MPLFLSFSQKLKSVNNIVFLLSYMYFNALKGYIDPQSSTQVKFALCTYLYVFVFVCEFYFSYLIFHVCLLLWGFYGILKNYTIIKLDIVGCPALELSIGVDQFFKRVFLIFSLSLKIKFSDDSMKFWFLIFENYFFLKHRACHILNAKWCFKHIKSDNSLFCYKVDSLILLVLVYVEDILVIGNNKGFIRGFTQRLNKVFSLEDLSDLHFFLGFEVHRDNTGIYLSQRKYVHELLSKHNMLEAKPCSTPMTFGKQLSSDQDELLENPTVFRSVLGGLQYLTIKHPYIYIFVKRVLCYLKGTIDFSFHIKPSLDWSINGYFDANWAANLDCRRFIAGLCVFMCPLLIKSLTFLPRLLQRQDSLI